MSADVIVQKCYESCDISMEVELLSEQCRLLPWIYSVKKVSLGNHFLSVIFTSCCYLLFIHPAVAANLESALNECSKCIECYSGCHFGALDCTDCSAGYRLFYRATNDAKRKINIASATHKWWDMYPKDFDNPYLGATRKRWLLFSEDIDATYAVRTTA